MNAATPQADMAPLFSAEPIRPRVVWGLAGLLLFFGQTFHYLMALWPLWALSKAFPVLSLPLALRLRHYPRFPMARQVIITLAWMILVPSFAAGVYFHQNFFTSLTAQVKLLPLLYFFSFLAVLLALRPTLHEMERSFIRLGLIVSVVLIVLWAVVPDAWYSGTYVVGDTPFFSHDNRGNRIRMSMYFPLIALFFFYRRAFFERSFRYLLAALVVIAVTVFIVKTRAMVVGIIGVLAINTILWSRPLARAGLLIAVPFVVAAVFSAGYLATTFSTDASSGFDVRQTTLIAAARFLGDDPLRWILGVGTISPTSPDSLMAYFNHFFFLADITWLGVVFEYGLIGAVLLLALSLRGLLFYRRLRTCVEDDFLGALRDYLVYVVLISVFYPMTLTPGESAVIFATFTYVWYAGELDTLTPDRTSSWRA
jgi:hypothetical protein